MENRSTFVLKDDMIVLPPSHVADGFPVEALRQAIEDGREIVLVIDPNADGSSGEDRLFQCLSAGVQPKILTCPETSWELLLERDQPPLTPWDNWLKASITSQFDSQTQKAHVVEHVLKRDTSLPDRLAATVWELVSEVTDIPIKIIESHISQVRDKSLRGSLESRLTVVERMLRENRVHDALNTFVAAAGQLDQSRQVQTIATRPFIEFLAEKQQKDQERDCKYLGYEIGGFPRLSEYLDGLQAGNYPIGGFTSQGKTSFACNIGLGALRANPKVRLLYLSLDDPREKVVNRFLGIMSGLSTNQVARRQTDEARKQKLEEVYEELRRLGEDGRLDVREGSEISTLTELEELVDQFASAEHGVLIIDDFYNLGGKPAQLDLRAWNIDVANRIKRLVELHGIPVICTGGELRKPTAGTFSASHRPNIHDLLETGKYSYNADAVLLIYPQSAKDYDTEEEPIMEVKFAKNKLSSFRGTLGLRFYRSTGKMVEVDPDDDEEFDYA